jgi:hypothetical protein
MRFYPCLFIDPKIDQHLAESVIVTEWDGETTKIRKGTVPMAVSPSKNYVWLQPKSGVKDTSGLGFIVAGDTSRMASARLGEFLLLGSIDGVTWLKPGEKKKITSCIHVDPSSSEDLSDLQEIIELL